MSVIDRSGASLACVNDELPRALKLKVHPSDSAGVYYRPGYVPGEGEPFSWHDNLVAGPIEAYGAAAAKHLSDAELAAEYWATAVEHRDTIERFATTPSAGVTPGDIP